MQTLSPMLKRRHDTALRRANTLVLVAGILVLLVIIATAYITRTQAGRITSQATMKADFRDTNARSIAEQLAQIPADALFVWPVDSASDPYVNDPARPRKPASSHWPRLLPEIWNSDLFGTDRDIFDNTTLALLPFGDRQPDHPYNFAPYYTVPNTNWPDPVSFGAAQQALFSLLLPAGPGNPNGGGANQFLNQEANQLGNPGFGDNRWLRDTEPIRWDSDAGTFGQPRNGSDDQYLGWRHLSYIGTPNNGWRLCTDIADVFDFDGDVRGRGRLLTGESLVLPVEQWIPRQTTNSLALTAGAGQGVSGVVDFWDKWATRFALNGDLIASFTSYSSNTAPENFLRLADLNADNSIHNYTDRPVLAYRPADPTAATPARWNVERVLTDTDGDGFTDAFWWLAPTPLRDGSRQVVAVSIIDNSSMFNVNTGSRFILNDTVNLDVPSDFQRTRGWTPVDMALVGRAQNGNPVDVWNVGILDAEENHTNLLVGTDPITYGRWSFGFSGAYWAGRFAPEIGFPSAAPSTLQRLDYWNRAASRPLRTDTTAFYQPFTFDDELELRMYNGSNSAYTFSRLEWAVQPIRASVPGERYLRANADSAGAEESSEFIDQPPNFVLLQDMRHRLTTYNGSRNDLMPPWLWYVDRFGYPTSILNGGLTPDQLTFAQNTFERFSRQKLDLRERDRTQEVLNGTLLLGERTFAQRLASTLALAFSDGRVNADGTALDIGETYVQDSGVDQQTNVRRLSAGFAANILAWRDQDQYAPLFDRFGQPNTVPLPELGPVAADRQRQFLGLEPQPFLMEMFIGHVYESWVIPGDATVGPGYLNSGERIFVQDLEDGSSRQSTVVVLQIANPFDTPIYLNDPLNKFGIKLLDETTIDLYEIAQALNIQYLPPARDDRPSTMILYSIDASLASTANFRDQWLDFLDIQTTDHPQGVDGTIIINLQDPALAGVVAPWSTDRDDYDGVSGGEDVAIVRLDNTALGGTGRPAEVVIDRFDPPRNKPIVSRLTRLAQTKPPTWAEIAGDIDPPTAPPSGEHPPGSSSAWEPSTGNIQPLHMVQWMRVARGWGYDQNGDLISNPSERSPRYVISENDVIQIADPEKARLDLRPQYEGRYIPRPADDEYSGSSNCVLFNMQEKADASATPSEMNMPWFTHDHVPASGDPDVVSYPRKPTYFNMNRENDFNWVNNGTWGYPDKNVYKPAYRNAMQMLHKDGDFERIGELGHVFMSGHELEMNLGATPADDSYKETRTTFSEFMSQPLMRPGSGSATGADAEYERICRNRLVPGPDIGVGDPNNLFDPNHGVPALPAGVRVYDAFVCDGPGVNYDSTVTDLTDPRRWGNFNNAAGFTGNITPGLVNLSTFMPETGAALPHSYKLVHETFTPSNNPRVSWVEGAIAYRERYQAVSGQFGNNFVAPRNQGPDYSDREKLTRRGARGFASIGELLLVNKTANADIISQATGETLSRDSWSIYYAGSGAPFFGASAQLSTDLQDVYFDQSIPDDVDVVHADSEEYNMLFDGVSNMVSVRSDVFTIYFKIRTFRKNPQGITDTGYVGPLWDATDKEFIIDESRWVMLVDRSQVRRPTDKPKILYLERLPN
jgi:hypothetical protein